MAQHNAPKKRRVFMWVFLGIQALFVAWMVAGLVGVSDTCSGQTYTEFYTERDCHDAASVGTAAGIFIILAVWFMVDAILGVIYLVTRRRPER